MATAEVAAGKRVSWSAERVGGIAGLGFAAGVILQNAVLSAGSPVPGSGLDDVVRYYTDNSARVMIATGWVSLNFMFLLTFLSAVTDRLREVPESALWGRVAYAAGIALASTFAVVAATQALLVSQIDVLAGERAVLGLLWELHSGLFAMSMVALGTLLGALSLGSLATRVVPRWTTVLGMIGSVLLLGAGAFSFNVIEGGPALFLGLAGFGTWVVWLIMASLRMVRSAE